MKNTFTADTLIVLPLDTKKIIHALNQLMPMTQDLEYIVEKEAILEDTNVVTDDEAVYQILEFHLVGSKIPMKISYVHSIGVRLKKHLGEGRSQMSMTTDFYFDISDDHFRKEYALAPVSLKEFMGSRFDYNPRIMKNTRELLKEINENAK